MSWQAVLLGLLLTGVSLYAQKPKAEPHWVMKDCFTLDCVTETLNGLPLERALEAKITTINSQRSAFGALSSPYYIWYRK